MEFVHQMVKMIDKMTHTCSKILQCDPFLPLLLVLHLLKIHFYVACQFCLALQATTYLQLVSCVFVTLV